MDQEIQKIITDGTLAPSGENCQPWKFEVHGNKIHIFNIPELDQSLYNFQQKGSYVAHGALIENMAISASEHGYKTDIELFPRQEDGNLIATITLNKTSPNKEALHPYLEKRHTNRKDHKEQKLTQEQKNLLINAANETG